MAKVAVFLSISVDWLSGPGHYRSLVSCDPPFPGTHGRLVTVVKRFDPDMTIVSDTSGARLYESDYANMVAALVDNGYEDVRTGPHVDADMVEIFNEERRLF